MSLRIHELAKRHNMEGKDMLALLKERGYVSAETKSVSSTVANIYVEEIEKEFATKVAAAATAAPAEPAVVKEPEDETPHVRSPHGAFVKTKDDVDREKAAAAAAKAAALKPAVAPAPVATPPPLPPRHVAPASAPSAPRPVTIPTAPPRVAPPPPPAAKAPPAPPPLPPPRVVAAAPVSTPPPVGVPAPVSAPPVIHPVMKAPAPVAPPPVAPIAPRHFGAPPVLPPLPGVSPAPIAPPTPTAAAPAAVPPGEFKTIHLKPPIVVRDFATALGLKPFRLISELNQAGGFASMNSNIDEAIATKVAEKHGFLLEIKHRGEPGVQQQAQKKEKQVEEDESKFLVSRPPVVCILGHVDHGKTSLLDAIRKANVAAGEAGGITQHIGAYQIEYQGRKITFLDTPGHAAFSKMRARGANVTDIAVLVVAADDGFMPQTDEALKHAQNAKVALVVAVNKMDVKGANLDQVKAQMQQRNIAPEDWGGETITVPVAATKGQGIDSLIEMILLQADVLELKANPKAEASGVVIESQVDVGRGPLATVIVQRGTLRVGDALVCGACYARVRAMFNDQGENVKEATPAAPVRVIGWSGTPESGAIFKAVKNAREAEKLAEEEQLRLRKAATASDATPKEVSVEQLFANIAATQAKVLKLIIKTDVFGSAEAVRTVLEGIKSTKVSLELVSAEVGLVTKNDVLMASAAGATVIGFNTKLENGVTPLAKHHSVRVETFSIIYELADRVKEMMADLLEPDIKEIKTGAAEVRQVFPLAKGFVAGCLVTEGKITRNASARLRRGRELVHEGKIATLKRFKDDANEVRAGLECGIKLDDFNGYQAGDVIEVFEIQKVRASL
ncbi:translation initiation factor IF-2 [Opitutus terrae]|uniref:Translation initiation factor IF-2 n=1 Tax=Opitutus terrae (strain DSM 11246 / JCM 15787 / PB90-1) TaxID=452637 RepID=B1ZX43_OPITP|nr:translation initiation factor IF-2 [Opitutus terrae]ACB76095.1 translation initiation factor IF-2 [Opitutus terrae PB90-1]